VRGVAGIAAGEELMPVSWGVATLKEDEKAFFLRKGVKSYTAT